MKEIEINIEGTIDDKKITYKGKISLAQAGEIIAWIGKLNPTEK